jgi:hypothetical protein
MRIMILVIAAVLPWVLIFARNQMTAGAYFEYGALRQDFLIVMTVMLQLPITILVAWGFKPSWQRALGIFVANNLFFVVGWYLLGFYIYEACRE